MEVSAKINGQLQGARSAAERLLGMFERNPNAVQTLRVHGKEDVEDEIEVLDLLSERLTLEYDMTTGDDLRFPREQRWAALLDAKKYWRAELR